MTWSKIYLCEYINVWKLLIFSFFSILGAFQFVFGIEGTLSIIIAVIPPAVYMLICFVAKPNFQITIAAILSVIYAFLMTASLFSIIGNHC